MEDQNCIIKSFIYIYIYIHQNHMSTRTFFFFYPVHFCLILVNKQEGARSEGRLSSLENEWMEKQNIYMLFKNAHVRKRKNNTYISAFIFNYVSFRPSYQSRLKELQRNCHSFKHHSQTYLDLHLDFISLH